MSLKVFCKHLPLRKIVNKKQMCNAFNNVSLLDDFEKKSEFVTFKGRERGNSFKKMICSILQSCTTYLNKKKQSVFYSLLD